MLARGAALGHSLGRFASRLGFRLLPLDGCQTEFEALDDVCRHIDLPLGQNVAMASGRELIDGESRQFEQGLQFRLRQRDAKAARHRMRFHVRRSLCQGFRPASGSLYSRAA